MSALEKFTDLFLDVWNNGISGVNISEILIAISLKTTKDNKPIIFSEWSFISGSMIKRTDYSFSDLISYQPFEKGTLFSDLGEKVIIPDPLISYKPTHYLNLEENVKEKL